MQREIDDLKKKLCRAQQSGPLPVPMAPPIMKMMLAIGEGQELRRANLSPTMKSVTTCENIKAHLAKVWEMTL